MCVQECVQISSIRMTKAANMFYTYEFLLATCQRTIYDIHDGKAIFAVCLLPRTPQGICNIC